MTTDWERGEETVNKRSNEQIRQIKGNRSPWLRSTTNAIIQDDDEAESQTESKTNIKLVRS